ncbi:hypothetical protein ACO03_11450 [Pantoea ananatis]|nr:hypothetical protein ACO03_11450 [Pantoea ananatis]
MARPASRKADSSLPAMAKHDEQLDEVVMGNRRYSARELKRKAADKGFYDWMKANHEEMYISAVKKIQREASVLIEEDNLKKLSRLKPLPDLNTSEYIDALAKATPELEELDKKVSMEPLDPNYQEIRKLIISKHMSK